ncbi:MAG: tetratricopeptide repeat protein [Cytophagaceae bacterium]|nr:MAG: tetratricopeptide repeat protein [Cytophagaceae bacterium]
MTRFSRKQAGSGRNWLRGGLWGLGWLAIAIPIARVQLADLAVVNNMPGQALIFDAGQGRGLAGLAVARQLQGEQQDAITLARAALKREPMNVAALRSLGFALEQTGDKDAANRILFLAGRLGWRDVALQLWLIKTFGLQGNVAAALHRADALARVNRVPEITSALFMASIKDDQLRAALVQELKDRPNWRGPFFYRLLQLPANQIGYFEALVADLAKVGSPINPAERAIYLTRLIQVGKGADAYRYWLRDQKTGKTVSTVPWDGGFEHVPPAGTLGAPFEWQMSSESAGVASIVPSPRGGQQVTVSPGHDFNGNLMSQTVILQPGKYTLNTRVLGDPESMGLRWTIQCLPDHKEVGLATRTSGSELASVTFEIPIGCIAQSLTLEMSARGDGSGSEDVSVDDVAIQRNN